jgi:hypothetical protein
MKLPPIDQMDREWLAWRQVCKQLAKLDVDINQAEPLACAIRLWGEELHALRLVDPKWDEKALAEKRAEYAPHVVDNWAP